MFDNKAVLFIQLLNSLSLGMNLFIIAAGLTLVFGVLRIVNFAHGSFYMIGAYVAYSVIRLVGDTDLGFWAGVVGSALVMGVLAFFIERLLLNRLYDKDHMLQLLFTFALVLIFKDLVKIVWGTETHSISTPPSLQGAVNLGITPYPTYPLVLCVLGPLIALAIWLAVDRSRWGRIVRAAQLDREMLSALGTDVKRIYSTVFVLGAMLAAVGGALAAPRSAVDPSMDGLVIIDCFVIVIIGGMGSLLGSFIGALILGFVSVFGALFLQEWAIVTVYVLMVATLLIRPWGLYGQSDEDRH
jgi:branched-subunit amino acid ABC-type transport system permease component